MLGFGSFSSASDKLSAMAIFKASSYVASDSEQRGLPEDELEDRRSFIFDRWLFLFLIMVPLKDDPKKVLSMFDRLRSAQIFVV
mmetsp:Transcript_4087/g.5227  ORF Transcript_4087/g.5227 Transcript_4087/m.5227 type:complete len:84 (-) Transcript_4087:22-273(-)